VADDPWRVLGVEPSAPLEEARQAYLLRSQLVHPDRHQGAAPRVRAEAERAMRELNDAWLAVQHLRGTPAEDDAA
jgi:curved DNA-binding protein CbpA